jgi:hypothetical protein
VKDAVALECAFVTWRSIAKGTLALPVDAAGYDQKFATSP